MVVISQPDGHYAVLEWMGLCFCQYICTGQCLLTEKISWRASEQLFASQQVLALIQIYKIGGWMAGWMDGMKEM